MLPSLKPGDEVLVDQRAYRHRPPAPGDVVIVYHPLERDLKIVKRVVRIGEDGRCYIEGDNLAASSDSRTFGSVSPEQIIGRVTSLFP